MQEVKSCTGEAWTAHCLHSYTPVLYHLVTLSKLNKKGRGTAKVNGSRPISYHALGSIGLAYFSRVAHIGSPKLKDHKA